MIFGNLDNIEKELAYYPETIQKGLRFLMETDLMALAAGDHAIDGDTVYAKVMTYTTDPKSKRRPERHVKYIDIQCVAKGREAIGSSRIQDGGEVDTDRLAEIDAMHYKSAENETYLTLEEGMFAIYFPWDLHRANCAPDDEPGEVKKIVVKVALNSL